MNKKLSVPPRRQIPTTPKATVTTPQTNGEKEETPIKALDLGFEIDPAKIYIFETLKKSEQVRNENLGSETKAYDPIEKRYRDLRYYPTAPSIFPEEWDDSFLEMQSPPLGFYRNILTAAGEDTRLMEYLTNHPLYEHSPFRVMNKPAMFTLADKDVLEEMKAKRHATEMRALETIDKTSISDVRPIARTMFGITETSETAILNRMKELVKMPKPSDKQSNAEKFLENIGNPKLMRQYHVQAGIDMGIIAADFNKMRVSWVEGNVFICQLKTNLAVTELVNFTFTEDGAQFYSMLRQKV